MLRMFPLDKTNSTKNTFFFLSEASIHHSFTFNLGLLYEIKLKVRLSETVCGIFHWDCYIITSRIGGERGSAFFAIFVFHQKYLMQLSSALSGLNPQIFSLNKILIFFLKKFPVLSQKRPPNFHEMELSYILLKKVFLYFGKGIFRIMTYSKPKTKKKKNLPRKKLLIYQEMELFYTV